MISYFVADDRIEYKRTPQLHWDDLAKYYSAFSNSPDGGLLCVGVTNGGDISGCNCLTTEQLNRLQNFHVQGCPSSRPEFKKVPTSVNGEADFVLLIYLPHLNKLIETNKDEAWVRYGDSKHAMSDEERRDFRATRNELSFEMEVSPYKYPSDFDLKIVQDFCEEFRRRESPRGWSDEEILADRFLVDSSGGIVKPRNSLVLLAAKDPRATIPGSRVRVQRFETDTEGSGVSYNPIRDRFAEGNIVEVIIRASKLIEEALHSVTWLSANGKFVTTPEYPKWAWFEALVNACVHRSYVFSGTDISVKIFPDRMEIESPGGFVPPVNENTIYNARSSRNPHLMDALRYLGYVQMAREGTRRMRESMKEYMLPDPQFTQEVINGVVVKVTLHNDHRTHKRTNDSYVAEYFGVAVWKSLQEHEIDIAAYVFRNSMIQVSEASRMTGRTWATAKKDLERLCRKDVLKFVAGEYPRDPKAHYALAKEKADGQ